MLSQRPSSHRPAVYCHAFLCALLLLAVVAGRSSRHGWISGFEKAHRELQFVPRRPHTPEIRCSRNALSALCRYAVQFESMDETVTVSRQHARCCASDCPGSFIMASAGNDYRFVVPHMCVAFVTMRSCVCCPLLKVGAIFSAVFKLETASRFATFYRFATPQTLPAPSG